MPTQTRTLNPETRAGWDYHESASKMETAQREAVAYPESHSQVGTEPTQAQPQARLTLRAGAVGGRAQLSYLMTHQPSRSL